MRRWVPVSVVAARATLLLLGIPIILLALRYHAAVLGFIGLSTMCAAAIGMGFMTTQVLPWVYRRGPKLTVLPGPHIRQ